MNEKQFPDQPEDNLSGSEVQDLSEVIPSEPEAPIPIEKAEEALISEETSEADKDTVPQQTEEIPSEEDAEALAEKHSSIMDALALDVDTPVGVAASDDAEDAEPDFTFEPAEDFEPITDMPPLEAVWHAPDEDDLFGSIMRTDSLEEQTPESADASYVDARQSVDPPISDTTQPEAPENTDTPTADTPVPAEVILTEPIFMDSEEPFRDEQFRDSFADGEEFRAMFEGKTLDELKAEENAAKSRPTRKGRPKRKKGYGLLGIPHLIATCIWLVIILAIGVSLGRMIWVCAADVLAFGRESKIVTVNITNDDSIDDIAEKLHNAGLVRYPELFKMYAKLSKAEEKIITGSFELDTLYDYHALVLQMSPRSTNRGEIEVLIPEGYSCRQIFQLLEEKGVCTAEALGEYAANGELTDYWFLEGVERGHKYCLEGYLFPDTYKFYIGGSAEHALEKMLKGFDNRFTEDMYAQLTTLNTQLSETMRNNGRSEEYIAEHQLSVQDLLTVASLIEKETANVQESYTISSVIYNRLYNWGSTPAYLNIDATIIYALDGKTNLTAEDMRVDSPYNTYTNTGLPPAPIANPGLASIQAALKPESTSYYFYVLNPETGLHQFSKTLEEHEKWVAQFAAKSKEAE